MPARAAAGRCPGYVGVYTVWPSSRRHRAVGSHAHPPCQDPCNSTNVSAIVCSFRTVSSGVAHVIIQISTMMMVMGQFRSGVDILLDVLETEHVRHIF